MVKLGVGVTMVKSKDGRVAGIFTERDYLRKIAASDRKSRDVLVREVMTPAETLICVDTTHSVYQCMHIMTSRNIRHLPVVGPQGQLHGVVGMKDVVRQFKAFHEGTEQTPCVHLIC